MQTLETTVIAILSQILMLLKSSWHSVINYVDMLNVTVVNY